MNKLDESKKDLKEVIQKMERENKVIKVVIWAVIISFVLLVIVKAR